MVRSEVRGAATVAATRLDAPRRVDRHAACVLPWLREGADARTRSDQPRDKGAGRCGDPGEFARSSDPT